MRMEQPNFAPSMISVGVVMKISKKDTLKAAIAHYLMW